MYTAGSALIDALLDAGVSYIFANLGSDHPAIVESLAEARTTGRAAPQMITCPNEMAALSAAHGFAQVTGRAQCVLVHVECGTQALAGALHNAAKGRVPVLIFAGASPFTQNGELRGSRNEFIQWIQDVFDQRGIVRGYVKYDNEIRTGRNIKQLVHRAMQFAHSDPKGPVYLMGAREVMEEPLDPAPPNDFRSPAIAPAAIPAPELDALVADLIAARRPLVVTSYLGRNPAAAAQLAGLCRRLGIGVLESVPNYVNFPAADPLYQGNQWNEPMQNPALRAADLILMMDSDVPWIPLVNAPSPEARIYQIDVDPLKEQMPMWQARIHRAFRADALTALAQINEMLDARQIDEAEVAERKAYYGAMHESRRRSLVQREQYSDGVITPQYLTACIRERMDADTIILNEGISNYQTIIDHLGLTGQLRPGRMFTSGGGSLGWHGGASIGVKLALPESTVVALTGDGSYMFSAPASVHWMARRYGTPFLQVIYNNGGWKSPKLSTLAVHPDGYASRVEDIGVSFFPEPDYAGIAAAAGGAWGRTVEMPADLPEALDEALRVVRDERRAAVLDVRLPGL